MKNKIEILYKKTLESVNKKQAELEKDKKLLESLEAKLQDYLQEHKGKYYKLIEKSVPFETALFWKTNFPRIHAECSVPFEIKKFDINLVKEKYPKRFKKCSKMTEQIVVEK